MHGTHVPGEQGGERWEKIFKEIIAIFFSILMRTINSEFQEAELQA